VVRLAMIAGVKLFSRLYFAHSFFAYKSDG